MRKLFGLAITGVVLYVFGAQIVRAADLISVDWNVPSGNPIFDVRNMLPGDTETRTVTVTNVYSQPVEIFMTSVRTGGTDGEPVFEELLTMRVTEDGIGIFGGPGDEKTVQDFFDWAGSPRSLGLYAAGESREYVFSVYFPLEAGNEYQLRSVVFDISFTAQVDEDGGTIKINEVYYRPDSAHGYDCPGDRGIVDEGGGRVTIEGNGAGSDNTVTVSESEACSILQYSSTNIVTTIISNVFTGGNSIFGNTGGFSSIFTGWAQSLVSIINRGSFNWSSGFCDCGCKLRACGEWIELYNPTDEDVSLQGWKLVDASGTETVINANKIIPARGYALLSKSASTWSLWTENPAATKIELGSAIGDGLDNDGDVVCLVNPDGVTVDAVAWQGNTDHWDPAVPAVVAGHSIERTSPGFDTDVPGDWVDRATPTP